MLLCNINIKIDGDIWETQDIHDAVIGSFRFTLETMLSTPHFYSLKGDLNFIYYPEQRRFEIKSLPEKFKGRLEYLFETNSSFRKKFLIS